MNTLQVRSYTLVAVQFMCIVILCYLTVGISLTLFPIILITIAIAIGIWAILTMQFGNINIQPIPKQDAKLVTHGPYKFVRHPMYSAVLLAMLGIAININSVIGYVVWDVLFWDLSIKLRFEEKLLTAKFSTYQEYMNQTKRLFPFLW